MKLCVLFVLKCVTRLIVTHMRQKIRLHIYHDRNTYGNNADMLTVALNQNWSLCWFYFCLVSFIRHNHIWRKITMKAPMRIHLQVEYIYVWLVFSYMNKPLLPNHNISFLLGSPRTQSEFIFSLNDLLADWMTNRLNDKLMQWH